MSTTFLRVSMFTSCLLFVTLSAIGQTRQTTSAPTPLTEEETVLIRNASSPREDELKATLKTLQEIESKKKVEAAKALLAAFRARQASR